MKAAPHRFFVPVDVSTDAGVELAVAAIDAAAALATSPRPDLHIAAVLPPAYSHYGAGLPGADLSSIAAIDNANRARAHRVVDALVDRAKAGGMTATVHVEAPRSGVSRQMTELAASLDCDLIVVSSRGRRGLERFLYGSVAEEVARRSSIPVLLLHPTAEASARHVATS